MKFAVISDIHGNSEALKQVLGDIDEQGLDDIFCLGDIIGYGPEPNEVISLIRQRSIPTILGNHELAVLDPQYLEWFNLNAKISVKKTITFLSTESFRYIRTLASSLTVLGCRLVHGFPPDSALTYLTFVSQDDLKRAFVKMDEKICFLGHTHRLEIVEFRKGLIHRFPVQRGVLTLSPGNQYIINIGSVGQPRDGNPMAKYAIWDTDAYTLEIRFVPYDIKKVADKIGEIGLPEVHARRLWQGQSSSSS